MESIHGKFEMEKFQIQETWGMWKFKILGIGRVWIGIEPTMNIDTKRPDAGAKPKAASESRGRDSHKKQTESMLSSM